MGVAHFANWQDITSIINHICNVSAPETFSHLVDTSDSRDKRYSIDGINDARRKAASRVFDAIGSNPAHPYWGLLSSSVAYNHGDVIAPYYGEIGDVLVVPVTGQTARIAMPADPDEIESYRLDSLGTFTSFYGTAQAHNAVNEAGVLPPTALKYSTSSGRFTCTGASGVIRMIPIPQEDTSPTAGLNAEEYMADTKMPITLAHLNAKLALPMLIKEGDNLFRTATYLGQLGEAELAAVKGGAIKVAPIDVEEAIRMSQKMN